MGHIFSVAIKGQKQGEFKGETTLGVAKNKIAAFSFSYEVKSPRDPATGQATGKRQHLPIKIVKPIGAATPQIFQALVTNESLPEVTLEFVKNNASGQQYIYHTIKLTNAVVSAVRQFTTDDPSSGGATASKSTEPREFEEVSFVFQKIEIDNKDGKTTGMDDWLESA